MDAKTVYDKSVFTREEVARAAEFADRKIMIGAQVIREVELQMELHGLTEVPIAALSDSERECIEWGLINEVI